MARKSKEIKPLFPMEEPVVKNEQQPTEVIEEKQPETPVTREEEKPPVTPVKEAEVEAPEVQNKNDHQLQEEKPPVTDDPPVEEEKSRSNTLDLKYKFVKEPKYKTYVPHNVRIPKSLRRDLERIAKKLGIPLGKNTGFFQEFTIQALQEAVEKVKKELGID